MKKRRLFFVILIVSILGVAGWYWHRSLEGSNAKNLHAKHASPVASMVRNTTIPSASTAVLKTIYTPEQMRVWTRINAMLARNPSASIPVSLLTAAGIGKGQIIQGIQAAENQKPINAYAKVVDQNGNPVVEAKVAGTVLLNAGGDRSRNENYLTETDGKGEFKFENLHGLSLGVGFEKSGYEFNPKLYLDWWGKYKPDPQNPMVFTMWKLQGAEPMVHSKIHDYIPCDGTEVHYDLPTGKRVDTDGDLIVTLTRNPVDIVRGKHFDWQLSLAVIGGGLVEIRDPYPYAAPDEGYLPSKVIAHMKDDKDWTVDFNASYYVKARDGQIYARIKVSANVNYQPPPTAFDVEIYANPNSSRDLEYDPAKEIKPE